ncbi:MAG: hypothetical protein R2856_08210 [Caldilineaceae bacterium]
MDEVIDAACARGWTFMVDSANRCTGWVRWSTTLPHPMAAMLWIPSYGMVLGEDWDVRGNFDKLFWVLWQAGVKVLIIGGTSGIADWRRDDDAIHPGDIVLPWSFRTKTTARPALHAPRNLLAQARSAPR